jgi:hypothetical protein
MPDERHSDELNRFWNDLVRGRSDSSDYALAPEDIDTVQRVHALSSTPLPSPARKSAWHNVYARIQSPLLRLDEERPMNEAGVFDVLHPMGRLNGQRPVPRDHSRREVVPRFRQRLGLPQLMAALLLMLSLGIAIFVLGSGLRDEKRPAVIPAVQATPTVNPQGENAKTILTMTLPPEMLPHEGKVTSGLFRSTIPANTGGTWDAPLSKCCPGLRIDHVIEGSFGVQADGPVQVLRAGRAIIPSTIEAGKEITLDPGDTLFLTSETAFHYLNSESTPVELLSWLIADESQGGLISYHLAPTGWIVDDSAVEPKRVIVPSGPATMRLREIAIRPKFVLEPPAGVTLHTGIGFREDAGGKPVWVALGNRSDGAIVNPSTAQVTLYVLTLESAGFGELVVPTPDQTISQRDISPPPTSALVDEQQRAS